MVQEQPEMKPFPAGNLDVDGNRLIQGLTLSGERYEYLFLGGSANGGDVILEDVTMRKCTVAPGEFGVFANVRLISVTLDSMTLARRLRISSAAYLDNLILGGDWRGAIWIGPTQVLTSAVSCVRPSPPSRALDLRQLRCDDVTIVGVPLSRISYDPDRFVGLRLLPASLGKEWGTFDEWLQVSVNYIQHLRTSEGLFNLPSDESERRSALSGLYAAQTQGMVEVNPTSPWRAVES